MNEKTKARIKNTAPYLIVFIAMIVLTRSIVIGIILTGIVFVLSKIPSVRRQFSGYRDSVITFLKNF